MEVLKPESRLLAQAPQKCRDIYDGSERCIRVIKPPSWNIKVNDLLKRGKSHANLMLVGVLIGWEENTYDWSVHNKASWKSSRTSESKQTYCIQSEFCAWCDCLAVDKCMIIWEVCSTFCIANVCMMIFYPLFFRIRESICGLSAEQVHIPAVRLVLSWLPQCVRFQCPHR